MQLALEHRFIWHQIPLLSWLSSLQYLRLIQLLLILKIYQWLGFHFSCCLVCHFFIFYFLGTFATYSFLRGRINKSYTYSLLLLIISETSTFMSYNFSYYLFNDGSILKYMQIWTCQMKMVDMYSWARINSVSTNDGEKLYETHFQ